MDPVDMELLKREIDVLVQALATERSRHVAGLEPAPSLVPIFKAHGRAAHRDTASALAAEGRTDLAARVASLRADRAQASAEEAWRAAERAAAAVGPDGPVALDDAQLAVLRERDRQRRLAFGRAIGEAASQPSREHAVETRARARAEVGLVPAWEEVVEADALLSRSDDAYRDVLAWSARREAALSPGPRGDLTRADLLFVLGAPSWEGLFPRGMLARCVERVASDLRLELGRIRIDDASRPGAWPGVHVHETRVSMRRRGGVPDWLDLLDGVGQALAAAAVPFHRRAAHAAPRMGALLSGLLLDRGFVCSRLDVERKHAADVVRALALRQLFRLRARAAALRVASEVERGTSGAAWHEAHRDAMASAALASWPPGLAARDGDAARLAAGLRGAAQAERLRRALVEALDEDWWRNPRSGAAVAAALVEDEPPGGAPGAAGERPSLADAADALVAKLA